MSFFRQKFINLLNSFLETNDKKDNHSAQIPVDASNNDAAIAPESTSSTEAKQEENQPVQQTDDNSLHDKFEEKTSTIQEAENHIPDAEINTETNDTQREGTSGDSVPEPKEKCDHEIIHDEIMDTLLQTPKTIEEKCEKETVETIVNLPENREEQESENILTCNAADKNPLIEANIEGENIGNTIVEPSFKATDTGTADIEEVQSIAMPMDYTALNAPDISTDETEKPEDFTPETAIINTTDETHEKDIPAEKTVENYQTVVEIMQTSVDASPDSLQEITRETGKDETIPHEETKNAREAVQAQEESALAYVERNEEPTIEEFAEKTKEAIPNMSEKAKHLHTPPNDIEKLIEQREYLESLLKEKFTKRMTVMFTDLKGSTAIADAEGDIASRTIMKQHNDVLFPIIKKHDGILVKTMGDGTLSYFEDAQKALRAAVEAQIGFDRYNVEKKPKTLLLVTMGLHTGDGVVEENDIFGDVVNVASRIESASNPGEIYISEDTYNSLTNKSEIYTRFIKSTTLKGKKGEFRLYKAFWDEKEIELDKFDTKEEEIVVKKRFPFVKVSMMVSIPLMITYLLMLGGVVPNPFIALTASKTELRSLSTDISDEDIKKTSEHTVTIIFDNEE